MGLGLKPNDEHFHVRAQLGFHLAMLLLLETAVSVFWWLKKESLKSSRCLNPCGQVLGLFIGHRGIPCVFPSRAKVKFAKAGLIPGLYSRWDLLPPTAPSLCPSHPPVCLAPLPRSQPQALLSTR